MVDLKEIAPDGALLIGTSRIRTYFYDLLEMQGLKVLDPKKSHDSIMTPENLHYLWNDASEDCPGTGPGFCHFPPNATKIRVGFEDIIHDTKLCKYNTATKSSFVVFSTGCAFIHRALSPRGLAEGLEYARDELRFLQIRCEGSNTVVFIASEMALHDDWSVPNENSFVDNRNVAFNREVRLMALKLGMHFIDLYPMSRSAGMFAYMNVCMYVNLDKL